MKVRFKRLNESAVVPQKQHITDAGFDLTAVSKTYDGYHNIVYGTGIAVEIPEGYVGLIFPRSGIGGTELLLSNSVGVIDSGYRGEIKFKFKALQYTHSIFGSLHDNTHDYEIGDRIGQLVIIPYPEIEFEECDELTDTDRGDGGFNSTGRR